MRKYQQLILVLISLASISVLFMYKSENNRLKYVLQVVNFFGRTDIALMDRLENGTKTKSPHEFSTPLPVWQHIGDNFHVFSSFWNRNELVAGGESISIVVSPKDSVINFKCAIRYKGNKIINGKFGFVHVAQQHKVNNFSVYKFLCKISREFGTPESLILTASKEKTTHEILLRHTKNEETKEISRISLCVNLVPYNLTKSKTEFLEKHDLMQFFLYHQAIGIEDFLIYNSDYLSSSMKKLLSKTGLQLHYFPYNFPFDYKTTQTRSIIEMDCLMRNTNSAVGALLLEPNEFFFTNTNLQFKGSILNSLKHYENDITQFEIPNFSVCLNHQNKLLIDNTFYDPAVKTDHTLYLYKPNLRTEIGKTMPLPITQVFTHSYINCVSTKDLHDWKNSIREDFMQYIETVRNEVSFLF